MLNPEIESRDERDDDKNAHREQNVAEFAVSADNRVGNPDVERQNRQIDNENRDARRIVVRKNWRSSIFRFMFSY